MVQSIPPPAQPAESPIVLPVESADGLARQAALKAFSGFPAEAAGAVTYASRGRLLLIGSENDALSVAEILADALTCTVLAVRGRDVFPALRARTPTVPAANGPPVIRGSVESISGHLGEFRVGVSASYGLLGASANTLAPDATFDLILDLTTPPVLGWPVPPLGYYAPAGDTTRLEAALAELPEMRGEFEKPKFFRYDPDICAHGARGIRGCTRCLEVCPTLAISSLGEKIQVDPYLCQGAGSCSTACPTGAITYAYPAVSHLLEAVRAGLRAYREHGGENPQLLFHDAEAGRERWSRLAPRMPENVIPVQVEELGSAGMDVWLASLAYGAHRVALLATAAIPRTVMTEIGDQLRYARAVLAGMGHDPDRLWLVDPRAEDPALPSDADRASLPAAEPAQFQTFDEKRSTLRLAIDYLYAQAPAPRAFAPLPEGAPFGEIRVDRTACTLCMACVSVCPASAVTDGGDTPRLLFWEANCVQCGLCAAACPEMAITLSPRIVYDPEIRDRSRVLNEEPPFCCIRCGKPFATQSMIRSIRAKLGNHWMFQDPKAMERLQMCEDCRVRAMFDDEGGPMDVYGDRRV
jgi:ferredoxin